MTRTGALVSQLFILLVSCLGLVSHPAPALADSSGLNQAIGVFTTPGPGSDKTASVSPGQSIFVFIKTDVIDGSSVGGMIGAQFGVDIDPRLEVVNTFPNAALLAQEQAPDDWLIGFNQCIESADNPFTLMSYEVRLPAGATDIDNLRIDLRDFADGQPMLFATCYVPGRTLRLGRAGGVVLNPTPPTVVHLSAEHPVLVEGRSMGVAWESFGATTATLNGTVVPVTGSVVQSPVVDTVLDLQVTGGAGSDSAQLPVDVIRQPRVDAFTAQVVEIGGESRIQLLWDVRGADLIIVEGVPGSGTPYESALVGLKDPPVWSLTASNEWGPTVVGAALGDPEGPPVILDFRATPTAFLFGQDVELLWSVYGADQVSISPDVGGVDPTIGTFDLTAVVASSSYELTATNTFGTSTATVDLSMVGAQVLFFTANPNPAFGGLATTLAWQTTSAENLVISGVGPVTGANGSVQVTPPAPDTVYTMTVDNPESSHSRDVSVGWRLPVAQLTTDIFQPASGELVTLTIYIQGALSATLDPIGPIDPEPAEIELLVNEQTTFVLTATNALGSVSDQITIRPAGPSVSLTTPNHTPFPQDTIALTATVSGATSATLEPGFGDIDPAGGVFETQVTEPTTFVLSASNGFVTNSSSLTVTPQPPTATLSASNLQPAPGESVTLIATAQGADTITLEPGFGEIDPIAMVTVTPNEETTYTLTATNVVGSTVRQVTISPTVVATLTASSTTPFPDETIDLVATILGATEATLEPGVGSIDPAGGTFQVQVTTPTTFVLTATNGAFVSTSQVFVAPQTPTATFGSVISEIVSGATVALEWVVGHADLITIEPGGFSTTDPTGSLEVSPTETTTYTLTATNAAGSTVRTRSIIVVPLLIKSFTATPDVFQPEEPVLLEWEVLGAPESVVIDGFAAQPAVGSLEVFPTTTTLYTLRASAGGFERTRTVLVSLAGVTTAILTGDLVNLSSVVDVQPFVPFDIYVVVTDISNGIAGFEFEVLIPPDFFILGRFHDGINVGQDDNYIVGLGDCFFVPQHLVLRLFLMSLDPNGASGEFRLIPATPASIPGEAAYLDCLGTTLPLHIGEPLTVGDGSTGVPVFNLELQVRETDDGVEASWDIPSFRPISELVLMRETGSRTETVGHWNDPAARGSWVDTSVRSDRLYRYRAVATSGEDQFVSESQSIQISLPLQARSHLLPNRPNPFNPSTTLRWVMAQRGSATVDIMDVAGRLVWRRTLLDLPAGENALEWTGRDSATRPVASGVYLVRLTTDHGVDSRQISLLK